MIAGGPGMSAVGETGGPVTVLVARRVLPGKEVEFETWAPELTPGHVGELWHVVCRFASADEPGRWEHSQSRSDMLAHGEQAMSLRMSHG